MRSFAYRKRACGERMLILSMRLFSVADPHHFDVDPDPDLHPACHFNADPDADPGPACLLMRIRVLPSTLFRIGILASK